LIERIAANVEEGRGGDANEMWESCGVARGNAVEPKETKADHATPF